MRRRRGTEIDDTPVRKLTTLEAGSREIRVTEQRPIRLGPVLAFIALWLGGSELVVGAVLHPMLPGGWSSVAALMLFSTISITVLVRGFAGSAYPGALTRLVLFRPFWYLMLFTPLLAVAAIVGTAAGLPFGASRTAGP